MRVLLLDALLLAGFAAGFSLYVRGHETAGTAVSAFCTAALWHLVGPRRPDDFEDPEEESDDADDPL